jgi:uncharacterized damage-inducible protein DinB
MKEFFLDKFEFDYYSNKNWIEKLEEQEDLLPEFSLQSMAHIINTHHIWVRRLLEKPIESALWDPLPLRFLERLNQTNFTETIDFLEKYELTEKVNYTSSEGVKLSKQVSDVLYHVLNHSNYHRAQIVMDLKQHQLEYPTFNFIAYR